MFNPLTVTVHLPEFILNMIVTILNNFNNFYYFYFNRFYLYLIKMKLELNVSFY